MTKEINKIFKIFLAMLVLVTTFGSLTTDVKAEARSSITLGDAVALTPYINNVHFSIKKTTSNEYVYCIDLHKGTAQNSEATLVKELDSGVAYILQNGYPNKSFTGEADKDYYITQSAVWWYLDDTTGSSNLGEGFKTDGDDDANLRGYITSLISAAKKAQSTGYVDPTMSLNVSSSIMTLNSAKTYFVSSPISISSTGISNFTVSLTDAPAGTILTDANDNTKTSFSANDKVIIKVPVASVSGIVNIKATVTATSSSTRAYEYQPTDGDMQNVAALNSIDKELKSETTFTIASSKVTISKVDSETNEKLAGAVLVVRDSNDNIIARFTTTTDSYTITNLANGTYTVSEESAPTGYMKSDDKISFTIDKDNLSADVIFKDFKQVVVVPNTNSTQSIILIIIGLGIVGTGITFVYKNAKKNK